MQSAQELTNRIAKLNSSQQALAEKLFSKLESPSAQGQLTLNHVVDEFEREHPELLGLLAQ